MNDTEERRDVPRMPLMADVDMRMALGSHRTVRIHNISTIGCGGTSRDGLRPDEKVFITLPGIGATQAQIVWSDQGRFGAVFAEPIDLEDIDITDNMASNRVAAAGYGMRRYG